MFLKIHLQLLHTALAQHFYCTLASSTLLCYPAEKGTKAMTTSHPACCFQNLHLELSVILPCLELHPWAAQCPSPRRAEGARGPKSAGSNIPPGPLQAGCWYLQAGPESFQSWSPTSSAWGHTDFRGQVEGAGGQWGARSRRKGKERQGWHPVGTWGLKGERLWRKDIGLWDQILYWVRDEAKKKGAMVKSRTGLVRNSGFPSGRVLQDWSYRMQGAVSMREGPGGLSCVLEVEAATETPSFPVSAKKLLWGQGTLRGLHHGQRRNRNTAEPFTATHPFGPSAHFRCFFGFIKRR